MTRSRPRHVKRAPLGRRLAPWGVAGAVGLLIGTAAALVPESEPSEPEQTATAARDFGVIARPVESLQRISRSLSDARPVPAAAGVPAEGRGDGDVIELTAVGHRFLTADLNLWSGPGEDFELDDVLPERRKVAVTGLESDGWARVLVRGRAGWVNAAYLVKQRPDPEPAPASPDSGDEQYSGGGGGGVSAAPCPSGSAVESGLTPDAIRVHRGVCAEFPQITSYGGLRSDGEHSEGRALDIMVSDQALGDAIAEWVRANHSALGVSEVLWAQRIWTVQRSSEGWRTFEDRGSATANHYDHVHVTVYGDSGG